MAEIPDSSMCMLSLSMLGIRLLPICGLCKVPVVSLWDWVVDIPWFWGCCDLVGFPLSCFGHTRVKNDSESSCLT